MAYYYTLDSSNYFAIWSVGAPFTGCSTLPDTVTVPDVLKNCSCNVCCYKYQSGAITYDSAKAAQCDANCAPDCGSVMREGSNGQPEWTTLADLKTAMNISSVESMTIAEIDAICT